MISARCSALVNQPPCTGGKDKLHHHQGGRGIPLHVAGSLIPIVQHLLTNLITEIARVKSVRSWYRIKAIPTPKEKRITLRRAKSNHVDGKEMTPVDFTVQFAPSAVRTSERKPERPWSTQQLS